MPEKEEGEMAKATAVGARLAGYEEWERGEEGEEGGGELPEKSIVVGLVTGSTAPPLCVTTPSP